MGCVNDVWGMRITTMEAGIKVRLWLLGFINRYVACVKTSQAGWRGQYHRGSIHLSIKFTLPVQS